MMQRFIPYRKQDLIEMCIQDNKLQDDIGQFRALNNMLSSIFHFEFHKIIESLKDVYAPIDPDTDTKSFDNTQNIAELNFISLLEELLEKANYERVTEQELNQALTESSMFKINLHVEFDDFSEVLIFSRGESKRQETIKSFFGLRSKTVRFVNYERVLVYIRFKDDLEQPNNAIPNYKPGTTYLKLFQNVPKADLEMLFPNTKVRMRLIDKLLIGIPAMISGGIVLTTKLGASLLLIGSILGFWVGINNQPVELNKTAIMTLLAGVAALGGYLWKQFNSFKNKKLRFMQTLTQNLYFKNLDNNAGVFYRLADNAEEEECKEAILAYYFLLMSEKPLSKSELDSRIEQWMLNSWDTEIDFEIEDALDKLKTLQLIDIENGLMNAKSINESIKLLDKRWDDYFIPSTL